MVSGSRFRGLLFRVGSLTFAKRNVLEGASVGKLGRGEGRKSRADEFSRGWGLVESRLLRWRFYGLRAKYRKLVWDVLGDCFGDVPRRGGGAVNLGR